MRHAPTLEFILDALPETAAHIEDLLAKARAQDEAVAAAAAGAHTPARPTPTAPDEDDDEPRTPLDDEDERSTPRPTRQRPDGRAGRAADGLLVVDKPAG